MFCVHVCVFCRDCMFLFDDAVRQRSFFCLRAAAATCVLLPSRPSRRPWSTTCVHTVIHELRHSNDNVSVIAVNMLGLHQGIYVVPRTARLTRAHAQRYRITQLLNTFGEQHKPQDATLSKQRRSPGPTRMWAPEANAKVRQWAPPA